MRRLTRHIREHGAATAGAVHIGAHRRRLQHGEGDHTRARSCSISTACCRSAAARRISTARFDLTERVAPELKRWRRPARRDYERFLVASALARAEGRDGRAAGEPRGAALRPVARRLDPPLARVSSTAGCAGSSRLPERRARWRSPTCRTRRSTGISPRTRRAGSARAGPTAACASSRRSTTCCSAGGAWASCSTSPTSSRPTRRPSTAASISPCRSCMATTSPASSTPAAPTGRGTSVVSSLRRAVPADALRPAIHRLARMAGARAVTVSAAAPRGLARALRGKLPPD